MADFAPVAAFGLPLVVVLALMLGALDRLARATERRGWHWVRRNWSGAAVGNALLELQIAFEPQRTKIELPAEEDGEHDPLDPPVDRVRSNVIRIDFVARRRLGG